MVTKGQAVNEKRPAITPSVSGSGRVVEGTQTNARIKIF